MHELYTYLLYFNFVLYFHISLTMITQLCITLRIVPHIKRKYQKHYNYEFSILYKYDNSMVSYSVHGEETLRRNAHNRSNTIIIKLKYIIIILVF
jgi:hypothetical protein